MAHKVEWFLSDLSNAESRNVNAALMFTNTYKIVSRVNSALCLCEVVAASVCIEHLFTAITYLHRYLKKLYFVKRKKNEFVIDEEYIKCHK